MPELLAILMALSSLSCLIDLFVVLTSISFIQLANLYIFMNFHLHHFDITFLAHNKWKSMLMEIFFNEHWTKGKAYADMPKEKKHTKNNVNV